jgi:hypothetical protein
LGADERGFESDVGDAGGGGADFGDGDGLFRHVKNCTEVRVPLILKSG